MNYKITKLIDKQYNFKARMNGKFPSKLKINKEIFKQLVKECTEVDKNLEKELLMLNKQGNPVNKYMNMSIEFNENVDRFELE